MLKHNREFQLVYRKGRSAHSDALVLFFLPDSDKTSPVSVGFTASKKVGNAVVRNRAKRRMRALFRELGSLPHGGRYVLVAKASTAKLPFGQLQKALRKMLRKVGACA